MNESTIQRISEMIYGDTEPTKDQKRYVKTKFDKILSGEESLYIRDKSQSTNLVEGICQLIKELEDSIKKKRQKKQVNNDVVKQSDWDFISNKYQDVLVEIKQIKDEVNNKKKELENEYYMKLKGNLLDTKPHQDLINQYIQLDKEHINLQNKLHRSDEKIQEQRETIDGLYETMSKVTDDKDNNKIRKQIEKEMSKNEDETKKQLQKQVNNLKKLLKLEQDKNVLLINNSL
eukprot:COSAG01_NODE_11027_length_2024_cov_2.613506_2_plen_232_part_00